MTNLPQKNGVIAVFSSFIFASLIRQVYETRNLYDFKTFV
jgi:hypothetical protein